VHPYRLREPFAALGGVRQYQIVQHPAGLRALVVLDNTVAGPETCERVRASLLRALADAGATPPPVEVVAVERIERESGHGAKLKLVKRVVTSENKNPA
jgi:hypothetical protein